MIFYHTNNIIIWSSQTNVYVHLPAVIHLFEKYTEKKPVELYLEMLIYHNWWRLSVINYNFK